MFMMVVEKLTYAFSLNVFGGSFRGNSLIDLVFREAVVLPICHLVIEILNLCRLTLNLLFQQRINLFEGVSSFLIVNVRVNSLTCLASGRWFDWHLVYEVCHV